MNRSILVLTLMLLSGSAVHGQGAIIETLEELANRPEPPMFRGVLPTQIDLSATVPSPADQGPTGTCTSWGATYAAASQALRRAGLATSLRLSPAFTYNQIARDPFCQLGTRVSDTLDLLRDKGALPLEEFAFDAGWCGRAPMGSEMELARKYRIKGWSRFAATDIETVKSQLARGVPVIFDIHDHADFKSFKGDKIFDAPGAFNGGGHTMVAVGYDDNRKAFRIQNSWGRKWGDAGYAWLSYRVWLNNTHVGYVVE